MLTTSRNGYTILVHPAWRKNGLSLRLQDRSKLVEA